MIDDRESEEMRCLRRSNHDFRVRLDRLEMERVQFVEHIARMTGEIDDLHRLVRLRELSS